ncbi:MAG: hypothetical protein IJ222_04560 [Bacteroidales bacterium]|nr:hypothetical protein [Bacteroidales bacterium]
MKHLCKLGVFLACVLAAVACATDMDPFQGGTGVRANINGRAYIMIGSPNGTSYVFMPNDKVFNCSVILMSRVGSENLKLSFGLEDVSALVTGKQYSLIDAHLGDASMSGTVIFNTLGPGYVEAGFSLSGGGYDVRHGFLRLKK